MAAGEPVRARAWLLSSGRSNGEWGRRRPFLWAAKTTRYTGRSPRSFSGRSSNARRSGTGQPVRKAVITVPAFFNEGQRRRNPRGRRELAGLGGGADRQRADRRRFLTCDPHPPEMESLLVYDLGGGTFDVSIAQVEQGVVEILASRGDTQLGGDDFDQPPARLLRLRSLPHPAWRRPACRGLGASESRPPCGRGREEDACSSEAIARIEEEFIAAEKKGLPIHLNMEIERVDYEELIEPLLAKTLTCLDRSRCRTRSSRRTQVDKVVLVGERRTRPAWCTGCFRNGSGARFTRRSSPTWPSRWARPSRPA